VQRIHTEVHKEKSWVRFGVSPFGIGKPSRRASGVEGFSQYDRIYADVELWLASCWMDYLVPQLYWPSADPQRPRPKTFFQLVEQRLRPFSRHLVLDCNVRPPAGRVRGAQQAMKMVCDRLPDGL